MAGLIAVLIVAALGAVVAAIFISTKLQQRRQQHRRQMENLVRGRTDKPETGSAQAKGHQFGGTVAAFTTAPSKPEVREAALVQQLAAITRAAQGGGIRTTGSTARDVEDAMVRRAERIYEQVLAEAARDNREPRSRPSGPCTLQINYVDVDGVWTTRKIAPYKSGNTNQKFDAWCEARQSRRTFLFERVQSAVDLTTGQNLTRAGVFQRIHPGRSVPTDLR